MKNYVLPFLVCFLALGCFKRAKIKLTSEKRQLELERFEQVSEKLEALRKKYDVSYDPVISAVKRKMHTIVLEPDQALTESAAIFFLHSLPSNQNDSFVQDITDAVSTENLAAESDTRLLQVDSLEKLSFEGMIRLGASESDIVKRQIRPSIYTLSEYHRARSAAMAEDPGEPDPELVAEEATQRLHYNRLSVIKSKLERMRDRSNNYPKEYYVVHQQWQEAANQITRLYNINSKKDTEVRKFKEQGDLIIRSFRIFLRALNGGQISDTEADLRQVLQGSTNHFEKYFDAVQRTESARLEYDRALRNISALRIELFQEFVKENPQFQVQLEEVKETLRATGQVAAEPSATLDEANAIYNAARLKTKIDGFEKFLEKNLRFESLTQELKKAGSALGVAKEKQRQVASYNKSYIDSFAKYARPVLEGLVFDMDFLKEPFRKHTLIELGIAESESTTAKQQELIEDFLSSLNALDETAQALKLLELMPFEFRRRVQRFLQMPGTFQLNKRYAGNMIIFFNGQVPEISSTLYEMVHRKWLAPEDAAQVDLSDFGSRSELLQLCKEALSARSENPNMRSEESLWFDPDCMRSAVNKLATSAAGQAAIRKTILGPFRASLRALSRYEGEAKFNASFASLSTEEFLKKLGFSGAGSSSFPFQLPPPHGSFRKVIQSDLSDLKIDFEELVASAGTQEILSKLSDRFAASSNQTAVPVRMEFTQDLEDALVESFTHANEGIRWSVDKTKDLLGDAIMRVIRLDVKNRIAAAVSQAQDCTSSVDAVPDLVSLSIKKGTTALSGTDQAVNALQVTYLRTQADPRTGSAPGTIDHTLEVFLPGFSTQKDKQQLELRSLARDRVREIAAFLAGELFFGPMLFGSFSEKALDFKLARSFEPGTDSVLASSLEFVNGWGSETNNVQFNYRNLLMYAAGDAGVQSILGKGQFAQTTEVASRKVQFFEMADRFFAWLHKSAGRNFRKAELYLDVPPSEYEKHLSIRNERVIQELLAAFQEESPQATPLAESALSEDVKRKMYLAAVEQLMKKVSRTNAELKGPLMEIYIQLTHFIQSRIDLETKKHAELGKSEEFEMQPIKASEFASALDADLGASSAELGLTDFKALKNASKYVPGQFAIPVCEFAERSSLMLMPRADPPALLTAAELARYNELKRAWASAALASKIRFRVSETLQWLEQPMLGLMTFWMSQNAP